MLATHPFSKSNESDPVTMQGKALGVRLVEVSNRMLHYI